MLENGAKMDCAVEVAAEQNVWSGEVKREVMGGGESEGSKAR